MAPDAALGGVIPPPPFHVHEGRGLVTPGAMKWWKNGNGMPMNSPHYISGCGYTFHGTYNPVAKGDRVSYGDVFEFRHNVADGGDATVRISGKLKFRGSL